MATSAPRQGILARLLPASGGGPFFELFEQHAERTRQAAELLAMMFREGSPAEAQAQRVKDVEHQGDEITHTVIEKLHQTFITPIDREDIHELISHMDDVLDLVDATSERLWLYDVRQIEPEARELADVLLKAVVEMGSAVRGLRDLKDRSRLIAHCTEINRLENEGDRITREAVASLFDGGIDPMVVIRWKDIFERLEAAIDACERVAHILESVVIKNA